MSDKLQFGADVFPPFGRVREGLSRITHKILFSGDLEETTRSAKENFVDPTTRDRKEVVGLVALPEFVVTSMASEDEKRKVRVDRPSPALPKGGRLLSLLRVLSPKELNLIRVS